ncbi:lanthionine synthetase LanC family protein [Streptomyces sp. NPDC001292]|uniref:lanthionine synthetase LanC family protein n=1 Tax=Streptomyces sp. NPDC001292 TaxID=3364558 RepID=UPI003690498D
MQVTTNRLIMPADVELARVSDFDPASLVDLDFDEGDWIVTRVASRSRSMILSADLAELFQSFRTPRTIIDAITQYAREHTLDPQVVLDESWPVLTRFLHANWLVLEHSYLSRALARWYEPGSSLMGHTVDACVYITDDTQVYRARTHTGEICAVKVVDATSDRSVAALRQEGRILERLGGSPSPRFLGFGGDERRQFLAMEWCDGVEVTQAVARAGDKSGSRQETRDLLVAVLSSYATLHDRQVIHGDVHPGNLLVDAEGRVRILDFGLARLLDDPLSGTCRGGAPEYFDPDYARASRKGMEPPDATAESEQYALGVLCYRVATGRDYLRFSPEAERFYGQIEQTPPLSFAENGVAPWPELESVLRRSLSKSTSARFPSVATIAEALSRVRIDDQPSRPSARVTKTRADLFIERVGELVDPNHGLFAAGPGTGPQATFMHGAAGIAYYLLRMALLRGDPEPLAAADQWAQRAAMLAEEPRGVYDEDAGIGPDVVGSVSPYHTRSGIELVRGLVAHARGDTPTLIEAASAYLHLMEQPPQGVDPTLGTTSVLAGCSHFVKSLRELDPQDGVTNALLGQLSDRANALTDHMAELVLGQPRNRQEGLVLQYTGAAHGWAGLMYTLMTWCEVANRDVHDGVVGHLTELAGWGVPGGRGLRWPVRTDEASPSFMNGWCHGSPGHVYLWNAAHRILGDTTYQGIAAAAAFATFEDQAPNSTLCCGQAGHVFALLNMYRHTQEEAWLRLASERLYSALADHDAVSGGQWSHSLYRGEVGLALAAVEIEQPDEARHPLFE